MMMMSTSIFKSMKVTSVPPKALILNMISKVVISDWNKREKNYLTNYEIFKIFLTLLLLLELEDQCWAFMDNIEIFSEDKAFLLYLDARRHGNKDLMELMIPRVQRFFLTLVSSKEFVELSFEEVCAFLKSNYICIHR